MQLNTLLKSINRHWRKHRYHISVLYNNSGDIYARGYDLLKHRYRQVDFIQETKEVPDYKLKELLSIFNLKRYLKYPYLRHPKSDFRSKLIRILRESEAEFVMFLTDDSQFITDAEIDSYALRLISADPYHIQYSLRLGRNINHPGKIESLNENQISWRFDEPTNHRDWRYNFSVDAHIYSRAVIFDLAQRVVFSNPNSYEAFTTIYCRKKGWLSKGIANAEPCILSFPINIVQDVQDNESLTVSTEDLEKWLDEGYELDYPKPELIDTFQHYPKSLILHGLDGEKLIETK